MVGRPNEGNTMHETTEQIRAAILARDAAERASDSGLTGHRIISTPNGQKYGQNGHVPCDHEVEFTYADGTARRFNGAIWR